MKIDYLSPEYIKAWRNTDPKLPGDELARIMQARRAYVGTDGDVLIAILRYSLFWDTIPFCNLLHVTEADRGKGCGRLMMAHWERDMKARGYDLLMTSTQADEQAQHFYRKLGYRDCGSLLLPFPGYEQPTELFMAKSI